MNIILLEEHYFIGVDTVFQLSPKVTALLQHMIMYRTNVDPDLLLHSGRALNIDPFKNVSR